jgi:hypothetical protein
MEGDKPSILWLWSLDGIEHRSLGETLEGPGPGRTLEILDGAEDLAVLSEEAFRRGWRMTEVKPTARHAGYLVRAVR